MSKYAYSTKPVHVSLVPSWAQLKNTYDLDDTCILLLNYRQVQAIIDHELLHSKDHLWGGNDEYLLILPTEDEERIQDIMDVANSVSRSNGVSWYTIIFAFVLALAIVWIVK